MKANQFIGAVIMRRFRCRYPIDEDGNHLQFSDAKKWITELEESLHAKFKSDDDGDGFTLEIIDERNNDDIFTLVCEITMKHLIKKGIRCIFWNLFPPCDEDWKQ